MDSLGSINGESVSKRYSDYSLRSFNGDCVSIPIDQYEQLLKAQQVSEINNLLFVKPHSLVVSIKFAVTSRGFSLFRLPLISQQLQIPVSSVAYEHFQTSSSDPLSLS